MPTAFMTTPQSPLPWASPLNYAAALDEADWALLYSGVQTSYSGQHSYLAYGLAERIEGSDTAPLAQKLTQNKTMLENAWFGYFGYGLKHQLEILPPDQKTSLSLPDYSFSRYENIIAFDHHAQTATLHGRRPLTPRPSEYTLPRASQKLTSNMTEQAYLSRVETLINHIKAGDVYQGNLTRKFRGQFESTPTAFNVFQSLCAASPAAYSALLHIGGTAIISSSPEQFLKISADGHVEARPIKGTSPRHPTKEEDEASLRALAASIKDQAENLMIVDLMRNDLARTCETGSVKVSQLFEITSHSHVHHMSSTVTGTKQPGKSALDVILKAFPPGSMTGAPKVMAMRLLTELERDERGVYAGALGMLGGDGSAELSVVIRTLILQGAMFEFQVGGGIVSDSTPTAELKETIDKSKGILKSLGLGLTAIP